MYHVTIKRILAMAAHCASGSSALSTFKYAALAASMLLVVFAGISSAQDGVNRRHQCIHEHLPLEETTIVHEHYATAAFRIHVQLLG